MFQQSPVHDFSQNLFCDLVCLGVMAALLPAECAATPSFMDPVLDWPRDEKIPGWH
jgi:hypothetical protein